MIKNTKAKYEETIVQLREKKGGFARNAGREQ